MRPDPDEAPRNADVGGALSRLLNALARGKRGSTFSAESHYLASKGRAVGRWRVALVDWLNGEPGHCRDAYDWHVRRGLYLSDADGVPRPSAAPAADA